MSSFVLSRGIFLISAKSKFGVPVDKFIIFGLIVLIKNNYLSSRNFSSALSNQKKFIQVYMTDEQIIQSVLRGDTAAFGQLVEKYRNMVFTTAMGFVHSREDAGDVSQEVFIQTFRSLKDYRGDSGFSTWLYRITVNTALNYVKAKQRRNFLTEAGGLLQHLFDRATDSPNPSQLLEQEERDNAVRKAIDTLPEKQRIAFVLSRYDELSQKEIAVIMKTSEGAVEQHLQRAKAHLRKKLAWLVGK